MDDDADEILEEVALSRCYTLQLVRARVGNQPALDLRMKHTDDAGSTRIKGGFRVWANKLHEVSDAIVRAQKMLVWDR